MARVNIDDKAFSDPRFGIVGGAILHGDGATRKDLIEDALGIYLCVRVWNFCTERGSGIISAKLIDAIYPGLAEALVSAELAEDLGDGTLRVKGTEGRVEWKERMRKAARGQGDHGVKGAKYGHLGKDFGHLGGRYGVLGGRPKGDAKQNPPSKSTGGVSEPLFELPDGGRKAATDSLLGKPPASSPPSPSPSPSTTTKTEEKNKTSRKKTAGVSLEASALVDLYATAVGIKPDAAGATYRSAERIVNTSALQHAALKKAVEHYIHHVAENLTEPRYRIRPWNFFGGKGGGLCWMDYVEKPKTPPRVRSERKLPDPNGVVPFQPVPDSEKTDTERRGAWVMNRLGPLLGLVEKELAERGLSPLEVKLYAGTIGASRKALIDSCPPFPTPQDLKLTPSWRPETAVLHAAVNDSLESHRIHSPAEKQTTARKA